MKRSTVNRARRDALRFLALHQWALPPRPRWDITDFGLGDFGRFGLTLVNLATEPEYCEKIMYARAGQATPCHTHARKKEDIICRAGVLTLRLWPAKPLPGVAQPGTFAVGLDGEEAWIAPGADLVLPPGSRVTLVPGVWHTFWPSSPECLIGEVSTANDDVGDNFFADPEVGRFSPIEEDEPAEVRLVGERD
jgi:D-lyxose ketol-isomerase